MFKVATYIAKKPKSTIPKVDCTQEIESTIQIDKVLQTDRVSNTSDCSTVIATATPTLSNSNETKSSKK